MPAYDTPPVEIRVGGLHQGENVPFLGPCGVGKAHLSIGLALTAIERGHRIYFLTLHDLVTRPGPIARRAGWMCSCGC